MEQLERIKRMGRLLKESKEACSELENAISELAQALDKYDAARKSMDELSDYYDSDEWLKDFADEEAGLIPKDIDRGALSEDGIFNLLGNRKEVEEILLQIKSYFLSIM